MATTPAGRMLTRQLQQMQSDKDIPGISCGLADNNIFEWEVMLMISDDVKLYGGECPFPNSTDIDVRVQRLTMWGFYRRLLPRPPLLPTRVPTHASEDEVRDAHFSPEQYIPLPL